MKCQAIAKRVGKGNARCDYVAVIEINGKKLCVRHARIEALSLALKKGFAKHVPQKSLYELTAEKGAKVV